MRPDADDPIAEALQRYAAHAPKPDWRPPAVLRGNVSRRRRARLEIGFAAAAVAISTFLVLALASWPLRHTPAQHSATTPVGSRAPRIVLKHESPMDTLTSDLRELSFSAGPAEKHVAADEQKFALALFADLVSESGGRADNIVSTPLSLDEALAMLELAASGSTRAQIEAATQSTGLTPAVQAAGWNALDRELASDADHAALAQRSGVVVEKGLDVKLQFLDTLVRYFGIGVKETDFGQVAKAEAAVRQWLEQASGSRAPGLYPPGALTPETKAVLVNALDFTARWSPTTVFKTSLQAFDVGGRSSLVPTMSASGDIAHLVTSTYSAVVLPFQGSSDEAIAIEPAAGVSMVALTQMTSPAMLDALAALPSNVGLVLTLPVVSTGSATSLESPLEHLGMTSAFTTAADFTQMTSPSVQIESAVQDNDLMINPQGTGVESSTAVSSQLGGVHGQVTEIQFDRPFLWLIRDPRTGVIVSEALVANPRSPS
ncbi:MAG TPA: serpin family protein [Acidimicrobiales bacterium]|nr:serpin family protein [Acidimicrobiales bacterium]